MSSLMYSISDEDFIILVQNSYSMSDVARKLGYNNVNGNTGTLFKKRCKELNIDYSHFSNGKNKIRRTEENIFCKDSTANQQTLRSWYKKGEYSEYKCAICGINQWNNQPLSLRLDHINGYNHDNRLENLRWVCPNCDSQLETYCGKNRPIKEKSKCLKCGKELSDSRAQYCRDCFNITQRKVERPSREELKQLIRAKSFTIIGKQFNVSDNTIRKWCDNYNLPRNKSDIKQYSDLEWALI